MDVDVPFGPPPEEKVPLVVPDVPDRKSAWANRTGPTYCIHIKTNGKKCGWVHQKNSEYCYVHNPAIPPEVRSANRGKIRFPALPGRRRVKVKTIKDVLELISARLDSYIERFGASPSVETEETICELVKTFVQVYKCDTDADAIGVANFSLKRRQA